MKKLLTAIAALMILTFTGCSKNPCDDVSCLNNGYCATGKCTCVFPYEGDNCSIGIKEKFLGEQYTGTATVTIGSQSTTESGNTKIYTNGWDAVSISLGGFNANITGFQNGFTQIVFPNQTVTNNGTTFTVQGAGWFVGNTLEYTLNMTTTSGPGKYKYKGTK